MLNGLNHVPSHHEHKFLTKKKKLKKKKVESQ